MVVQRIKVSNPTWGIPLEFAMQKYSGVRLEAVKKVIEEEGHEYVITQDEA